MLHSKQDTVSSKKKKRKKKTQPDKNKLLLLVLSTNFFSVFPFSKNDEVNMADAKEFCKTVLKRSKINGQEIIGKTLKFMENKVSVEFFYNAKNASL
jgi:hypothetical protein